MLLKRKYERKGGVLGVDGVTVIRAGSTQQFTQRWIDAGLVEGWLTMGGGYLTFGGIRYRITAPPGYYCCHCHLPQDSAATAKAHVASAHHGRRSPDRANPSGYRRDNFYLGVLA